MDEARRPWESTSSIWFIASNGGSTSDCAGRISAPFSGKRDLTVGDLHELVVCKMREAGRVASFGSWNGVRLEVGRCLNVSPLRIRRDSRLVADLGMS